MRARPFQRHSPRRSAHRSVSRGDQRYGRMQARRADGGDLEVRGAARRLEGIGPRNHMVAPDGNLVSSVLREYGDATRTSLFDYLPTTQPRRYLYDLVGDYPRRGG